MYQAYDAERASIVGEESIATIMGFAAARAGKPESENPFRANPWSIYAIKAWDHGWNCWNEDPPLLPWALVQIIHARDIGLTQRTTEAFRNNRELPEELVNILSQVIVI